MQRLVLLDIHGHIKSSSGRLSGCYWALSLPFIVSHQVPATRHRKRRGTSGVEKESKNFEPIKTQNGKRGSLWGWQTCVSSQFQGWAWKEMMDINNNSLSVHFITSNKVRTSSVLQ